jgi:tetratricopeptide (TPR) repeat protein
MDEMEFQERKSFRSQTGVYLDRNELPAVLDLAEARLKRTPGDLDARIAICRVWLLQGRIDEARDMLDEIEEIIASLSQIYVCMGDNCMKRGMREAAEDYYGKFKVLNPGAPLARDMSEELKGIEQLHETDEAEETKGAAGVPSAFQTVTLAELYIRQGHLQLAEEVLDKIIGQDPQNEKAEELRQEVRGRLLKGASAQQYAGVIAELSRWLNNIGRLRANAV